MTDPSPERAKQRPRVTGHSPLGVAVSYALWKRKADNPGARRPRRGWVVLAIIVLLLAVASFFALKTGAGEYRNGAVACATQSA